MKKNYICLFLFGIIILFFSFHSVRASLPLSGKIFVVDAGHGGVDPGAIVGSVYEKDINLTISLKLKEELEKQGAKVILTRNADYDLGTPKATYRKKSDFDHRISLVNHSKATYYISIHLNSLSNTKYSGPQVFYSPVLEDNKGLAEKLQNFLNEKLGKSRESKKIPNTIYMYSKLKVPGVLLECGFISNDAERSLLQNEEYVSKFAYYVAESFLNS